MSEEDPPQFHLLLQFSIFLCLARSPTHLKLPLALHSRLLPYKAAALCSQSLTRSTDGWMRHKLSIIVSPEDAVRTMPQRGLCLNSSPTDLSRCVYSSHVRRIHLSLRSPSPPSVPHHSPSRDFHPSCPLASPSRVTLPIDCSNYILHVEWMKRETTNER